MAQPLRILSLGAGVQSSALALMAARGALPGLAMPDAAIFADTQQEPRAVYDHLDWLETLLPFPVIRVTSGDLAESEHLSVPAYTTNEDGSHGMVSRQCTKNYKIIPIHRKLVEMVGGAQAVRAWRRTDRRQPLVVQTIGISFDEAHRMKPSRDAWVENVWPLVDHCVTREDCSEWFLRQTGRVPPRSACVFCPYKNDGEWRSLPEDEFARAVAFERKIQGTRFKKLTGRPFLHASRLPLDEVRFKYRQTTNQMNLLSPFGNECDGMCGV